MRGFKDACWALWVHLGLSVMHKFVRHARTCLRAPACAGVHARRTCQRNSKRSDSDRAHAWQRVYGVTFPDKDLLKDYQHRMEEARRRDHRNVGTQMELFFFDRLSPGSCFFMPAGARVYNALQAVRGSLPLLPCFGGPDYQLGILI